MEARTTGDPIFVDEAMMVAGLGCRKGVDKAQVLAAIDATLAAHGLERTALSALATVPQKRDEPGLAEAALLLRLPLHVAEDEAIRRALPHIISTSDASLAATGTGSVSEAAALAAAGDGAQLLAPRVATGHVTCALARGKDRP